MITARNSICTCSGAEGTSSSARDNHVYIDLLEVNDTPDLIVCIYCTQCNSFWRELQ